MTPADFKTIRESLGLSAQWLADAVHVDQRTVRRWEDGAIPLRADVVDLLTQLDEQMEANVDAELDRVAAEIHAGKDTDLDHLLQSLTQQDWPVVEVPRVDTDVDNTATADRPLPAAFYRAAASRLRWALGGRLHITYTGSHDLLPTTNHRGIQTDTTPGLPTDNTTTLPAHHAPADPGWRAPIEITEAGAAVLARHKPAAPQ